MTTERAIPRVRWMRVVYGQGTSGRPLFGFGAASDGGILVDVGAYAPPAQWEYGKALVPGGLLAGTPGIGVRDTFVAASGAPKLHYHRSGFVSLDQTGNLPRQSMNAVPLSDLREGQIFSVTIHRPDLYATKVPKLGDFFFTCGRPDPVRVTIIGVVGNAADLSYSDRQAFGDRAATILVSSEQVVPEPTVLLTGHGIDSWVRLEMFEGPTEAERFASHLFAFDPQRIESSSPREIIGVWTKNDTPKEIILSESHRIPGHPTTANRVLREQVLRHMKPLGDE